MKKFLFWMLMLALTPVALLIITTPMDSEKQFIFGLLSIGILLLLGISKKRSISVIMVVTSLLMSTRYMYFRLTQTLHFNSEIETILGLGLFIAEIYIWVMLLLNYLQTVWPLNRGIVPLPDDMSTWPTVDVYIPTYNEPLDVVRDTVLAAQCIDYPRDKMKIYILDDGSRSEFAVFAADVGVGYITRAEHNHAKAGNLNHAMTLTKGELICVFDCDHVATRMFLQSTVGGFLEDPKLALVQTPHYFYSPDPFERNLSVGRNIPNEGMLFYGPIQKGNDNWNATFFCGSCAIIRRIALDEIGGIAVETVTEDAHTSLRLHRKGYTSAYIRIPQAAGLATESLSAHIGQRIRWARGMVQIFRMDNPLLGKGLTMAQRICYANAMLHFLSGIPRLVFLTAPLAFLLLHAYIIYAPALMIALFVIPHMLHGSITTSRIQGRYRYSFWSEIYETVLAWYIAPPTVMALINPKIGKFNVTAKGGLVKEEYVDWVISRPYLGLVLLNLLGVAFGIWRCFYGPENEIPTVWISLLWVMYNLIVLGGAVAVSVESKQIRRSHRVEINLPAAIARQDGHLFSCTLHDFSDGGVGLHINGDSLVVEGQQVKLLLRRGQQEFMFPAKVVRVMGRELGLNLLPMTTRQHIDFVQCTFARADTWARWQNSFPEDKPVESMFDVLRLGFHGYRHLAEFTPPAVKYLFRFLLATTAWFVSFVPRPPERRAATPAPAQALAQQ